MKHELIIYCFDKWWKGTVEDECYKVMTHNVEVLVSPAVRFNADIVYDKSTKNLITNKTQTSSVQIEMEVWLMGNLPVMNLERKAFERLRKSYHRTKDLNDIYKN